MAASPSGIAPLVRHLPIRAGRRSLFSAVGVIFLVAFVIVGILGTTRYIETFWLYRGFAPPARPHVVIVGTGPNRRRIPVYAGTVQSIEVQSPALGGRSDHVLVYLPPNYYRNLARHYPVLYLLHGFPGSPSQFINVGNLAVVSDVLVAEQRIQPMIIVMPSGSTNFFTDNEWANSVRPNNDWETFVARDLVGAIDHRYRAIDNGAKRGIGGLSEGGYGALNITFHYPGEFDLIEGWSAYYLADTAPQFFGNNAGLLAYNSPADDLVHVAGKLRADRTYIWLYSGNRDVTKHVSSRFARELASLAIPHSFDIRHGHHDWLLWRSNMKSALTIASNYFEVGHGPS